MAKIFVLKRGQTVYLDSHPLFSVADILQVPFHVELRPQGQNPRRLDINSQSTIPVEGDTVLLKTGEPLLFDPDYSVMVTRIFNADIPKCRISIRCPDHISISVRQG